MSTCPRCGAGFGCGMVDPASDGPCWCTTLPTLPILPVDLPGTTPASCFCPDCLRAILTDPARHNGVQST